ncbi:MAG: rhodanese-like domain-containing protein [Nitrosopumilus sp.]|nr:rhodanese-like domain-containing protein [Nitrosopumilus sp.]
MLVSTTWLKDNLSDQKLVILDTRPTSLFLYGHLPNSQSVTIEQIIQFDQYGSNLVGDEEKLASLFGSLGIDETKNVIVVGDSIDPSSARVAWTLIFRS